MAKPKVAFYWCSSCGGCEEAVVDLAEGLLDVAAAVDIVLWPVAIDAKYEDIEKMEDGEITVSFINGAIRLDEQQEIAQLLRRKSQVVIAFGSCAQLGGIPGLANFKDKESILSRAFFEVATTVNPDKVLPQAHCVDEGHELTLPNLWNTVRRLDEVVDVDYFLPGCPPMPDTISQALDALLSGNLPEKGAILSPTKNLCSECSRRDSKPETIAVEKFQRIIDVDIPEEDCFLAHGVLCMGPATRSGCGERCISANMPCRGCYGPCDGVTDQGLAMLSALAGSVNLKKPEEFDRIFKTLDDAAGTLYRFSLPASIAHNGGLLQREGGDEQ